MNNIYPVDRHPTKITTLWVQPNQTQTCLQTTIRRLPAILSGLTTHRVQPNQTKTGLPVKAGLLQTIVRLLPDKDGLQT